jgi:hypothetical protein
MSKGSQPSTLKEQKNTEANELAKAVVSWFITMI